MLPESGCACWLKRGMVKSPDRKGDDHGTAAARDVGPGRPRRAGPPLPDHPRRHHPHPLPDDPVARRGPPGRRGRAADPLQPRHGPPGADRKSTRLNSSHITISYAVFCLKKKKKKTKNISKKKENTT